MNSAKISCMALNGCKSIIYHGHNIAPESRDFRIHSLCKRAGYFPLVKILGLFILFIAARQQA
jgi:hypothetical protein